MSSAVQIPKRDVNSVGFAYLASCRRIAAAAGVDLRTLDRALWHHSKEKQKSRCDRG